MNKKLIKQLPGKEEIEKQAEAVSGTAPDCYLKKEYFIAGAKWYRLRVLMNSHDK